MSSSGFLFPSWCALFALFVPLSKPQVDLYPLWVVSGGCRVLVRSSRQVHQITMLLNSAHGALERLSKTPFRRAFVSRYIQRQNPVSNGKTKAVHVNTASQYLPTVKALTLDHWTKTSYHIREIIRAGNEEEMKEISFVAGKPELTGRWPRHEQVETHEYISLSDD